MPISVESLIERMQWCAEQNLTAFSWSEGGKTLSIKREAPQAAVAALMPVIGQPEAHEVPAEVPSKDSGTAVTALLAGTCYLAPDTAAAPFVQLGDHVHKGQTLCLVEAMKVMTALTAEWDGTVTEICVEDGATVVAGDLLMQVQP